MLPASFYWNSNLFTGEGRHYQMMQQKWELRRRQRGEERYHVIDATSATMQIFRRKNLSLADDLFPLILIRHSRVKMKIFNPTKFVKC